MQHVFECNQEIETLIKNKKIFLFTDYDGTLAPIMELPEKAVLPKETKGVLEKMIDSEKLVLSIVSGRSIDDIKKLAGLDKIVYTGNHGLEIEGPGIRRFVAINEESLQTIDNITTLLSAKFAVYEGAFIEDKKLSVSLHYRNVSENVLAKMTAHFNSIIQPYLMMGRVEVLMGKKVFDVRPKIDWNKGNAILWLILNLKEKYNGDFIPIYMGDDITDENVFRCLDNNSITIHIGNNEISLAKYYVKDTQEVCRFLEMINDSIKVV